MEGGPSKLQGVHTNDFLKVEDLLQLKSSQYDIAFFDGELNADLARRIFQKYDKSVQLLSYFNHIYYVNNICFRF